MKKLIFTALLLTGMQTITGQHNGGPFSEGPSVGMEPGRTQTMSYPSQAEALEGLSGSSLYMQPLNGQWTIDRNDSRAKFSHPFTIPFSWIDRQQFVFITGATHPYIVKVNGKQVGYTTTHRTAAEFDITKHCQEGANTIEIEVISGTGIDILSSSTNTEQPKINGQVRIHSQPRVRIRDYSITSTIEPDGATLQIGVILKSHLLNPKSLRIHYRIFSPDNLVVANGHRDAAISMRGEDTVRFLASIPDAKLWSHEAPYLYTLELRTQYEGRYNDNIAYRFGIRNISHGNGTVMVNGNPVEIYAAPMSYTLDSADMHTRLVELRNTGYNTVIADSYPAGEYLYELCDMMGFYLCNVADINTSKAGPSVKIGGNPSNDPHWRDYYIARSMSMYYTGRNHASAVMFSPARDSYNGYNLYESYLALKNSESRRPIVYTDAGGQWNTDAVSPETAREIPEAVAGRFIMHKSQSPKVGGLAFDIIQKNESGKNIFIIKNGYQTIPLRATLYYNVKQGGKKMGSGQLPIDIPAGGQTDVSILTGKASAGMPLEIEFEIVEPIIHRYSPYDLRWIPRVDNVKKSRKKSPAPVRTLFKKSVITN